MYIDFSGLIEKIKLKDREALEELYEACADRLFAYIISIVGEYEMANDILQEVFADVWFRAKNYNNRWSVLTWIYSIARYKSYKYYKKAIKNKKIQKKYKNIKRERDVIGKIEGEDTLSSIIRIINSLPFKEQSVFKLKAFHSFNHKEVARIMHISVRSSKRYFIRACNILRSELKRNGITKEVFTDEYY